ncbi:MAG: hypothetical protein K2P79_14840 [Sphingomonas sp.]|nr:hypothetical protein [Sphingomonas sp.]
MSPLQIVKFWLVIHLGLAKDALHVYVGLTLLFGSALVFGWKLSSWRPWAIAALAAVIGEAWDIRDNLVYNTPIYLPGNWHDIWNTLFWPSAILLLARRTRLFGG